MAGTLFVLPVPLAEMAACEVLPPPVLRVAREAQYVLAENARSARAFLKAAGHPGPIRQVRIVEIGHDPQRAQALEWLAPLRAGASDAALVSECGCPGVADPGAAIVACAHDFGVPVRPLVGPSSVLLALMASGMNGQHFRFLGYLPQPAGELAQTLRRIERDATQGETQIFIETPYRTERLFDAILAHCADSTRLCLALDLGSSSEATITRRIGQWRAMSAAERPALQRRPAVFLLHGDSASGSSAGAPAQAVGSPRSGRQ
ncbi:MAG TPA: SAM-dependent methyltransferase [Burkholderiaceae bacterium]|jgi:16S rRNA (cytidine1402-2'-O)-methyltransferase|nr:SAM-dependent methyltransferase [Burkholderiaceae bacterium]